MSLKNLRNYIVYISADSSKNGLRPATAQKRNSAKAKLLLAPRMKNNDRGVLTYDRRKSERNAVIYFVAIPH